MFLKAENLFKNFGGTQAVNDISFQIDKGDIFGLLGPNGAGKSTTISMISTLLKPSEGSIYFDGFDIFEKPQKIRKKLGIVPQDIALYPTLTGYENLAFFGSLYGLKGVALKNRINEVTEIIGIRDRLKDKVEQYSGGMKRRLNIGAALLHIPELLIMDEPTVGIDPQSRNHILKTVLKLNEEGITIIYTSHYMEEVEYLCNRICIMDQGKIIASGTQDELVNLVKEKTQINIKLEKTDSNIIEKIKAINGIYSVNADDNNIIIYGENGDLLLAEIVGAAAESGTRIESIDVKKPNLEAVFLHLTGKALRD